METYTPPWPETILHDMPTNRINETHSNTMPHKYKTSSLGPYKMIMATHIHTMARYQPRSNNWS